jgi:hypothetical protein
MDPPVPEELSWMALVLEGVRRKAPVLAEVTAGFRILALV